MKKRKVSSRLILLLIVVFASFIAAFLGQVVTSLLSNRPSLISNESLIIRTSKDPFEALKETASKIKEKEGATRVDLFKKNGLVYSPAGSGLIATSDGWIAAVPKDPFISWTHVRLDSGDVYEIEETVSDPASDLHFVKISAENLRAATLGDYLGTSYLEPYLVLGKNGILMAQINDVQLASSLYLSSDKFNRSALISQGSLGDLVYNKKAELVGVVVGQQDNAAKIMAVNVIRDTLENLLRNGLIERPVLGIKYIDLSVQVIDTGAADHLTSGVFISDAYLTKGALTSLPVTSPAFVGGLRYRDTIVSIEGNLIDYKQSLSDYILGYKPGEEIELGVLRNGKSMLIKVVLGSTAPIQN